MTRVPAMKMLLIVVVALSAEAAMEPARAFALTRLDLAGQKHRQVVVDREEGQYLGHPSTVLLEDGKTIYCVYPKGHGRGALIAKRSRDGGRTWSDRLPVPASWATSQETPTVYRVVDAAGRKRLVLFSGHYPIRSSLSEDDGATWSELAPIGDYGGIVAVASCAPLKTAAGHYLAMFHDDGRWFAPKGKATGVFTIYQILSTDGGLTWGRPQEVWSGRDVHLCEPGLIRSADGKELAALLRENRRARNSHVIFSRDEGKTWTAPRELPAALDGDRHTAKYAPDGRLLVSFRDQAKGSPTRGDWVAWIGSYQDIVQGENGQYRVRLEDNQQGSDCGYPGVEVLPDGTFVLTTYGHWEKDKPPYILSVRLTLDELDQSVNRESEGKSSPQLSTRPKDTDHEKTGHKSR